MPLPSCFFFCFFCLGGYYIISRARTGPAFGALRSRALAQRTGGDLLSLCSLCPRDQVRAEGLPHNTEGLGYIYIGLDSSQGAP
jgi:hypothetical protein